MKEKTIIIDVTCWNRVRLTKYTNHDNIYIKDGEISDRDTLNATYKKLKNQGAKIQVIEREIEADEIEKNLMKDYDPYVEYIDDGNLYKSTCKNNETILNLIEKIKEI